MVNISGISFYDSKCPFCMGPEYFRDNGGIILSNIPGVAYGVLSFTPEMPGHVLIIPNEHYKDIDELPDNIVLGMHRTKILARNTLLEYFGEEETPRLLLGDFYLRMRGESNPLEFGRSMVEDCWNSGDIFREVQGFNFVGNEGKIAGQTLPHIHEHLMPRRYGIKGEGGVSAVGELERKARKLSLERE